LQPGVPLVQSCSPDIIREAKAVNEHHTNEAAISWLDVSECTWQFEATRKTGGAAERAAHTDDTLFS
jgi:hypothetical protein